jgi:histidinol-phosphate aminotransferase
MGKPNDKSGPKPTATVASVSAYKIPSPNTPIELKLGANEGAGPPIDLLRQIEDADLFRLYPDKSRLEAKLAALHGVGPECVLVTCGGDDVIDRSCRTYLGPGRVMVKSQPTFAMFEIFGKLSGGTMVDVPWPSGPFPRQAYLDALGPDTGIVVVVTPNNPTGLVATAEDLQALSQAAPNALLLVDLAYTEFADVDLMDAVTALPNALALRTFSKSMGMAGLRVGYAVAAESIITPMRAAGLPYALSGMSLALAERWFDTGKAQIEAYRCSARDQRAKLAKRIGDLGGEAMDSQGNFVFARFKDSLVVRDALAGLGIAVRFFPDEGEFKNGIRITMPGNDEDFARLCTGLAAAASPEAVLFDMDGVLADVSGSYMAAILGTAKTYGVELTEEEAWAAKTEPKANNEWALTQRLLSRHGVEASLDEVTERFERLYQGTEDQPGLRETETLNIPKAMLERLAKRFSLGIVTGRPRKDAECFLNAQGIGDLFSVVVCYEDAPLKPDPAPVMLALEKLGLTRAWMLGDAPDDLRAAKSAGVVPIGVIAPGDDSDRATGPLTAAGAARILIEPEPLEGWLP